MLIEGDEFTCRVTERVTVGRFRNVRVSIGDTGEMGSIREDDVEHGVSIRELEVGSSVRARISGHGMAAPGRDGRTFWYDLRLLGVGFPRVRDDAASVGTTVYLRSKKYFF